MAILILIFIILLIQAIVCFYIFLNERRSRSQGDFNRKIYEVTEGMREYNKIQRQINKTIQEELDILIQNYE